MFSPKSTSRLLLAGWTLVVGWLVAMPGLLPMVFAMVAWIDGEHGVDVRGAGESVSVVLTHGAKNLGRAHAQIHHHRLLGRVLTCCAQSPRGQADHVTTFASTNVVANEKKVAVAAEREVEAAAPTATVDFVELSISKSQSGDGAGRWVAGWGGLLPRIPAKQHALRI